MPDILLVFLTLLLLFTTFEDSAAPEKPLHKVSGYAARVFAVVCIALLLLHLVARPFVWQVWPLVIVGVVRGVVLFRGGARKRITAITGFAAGLVLIGLSLLLLWVLPVPRLPEAPPLGTFSLEIEQPDRPAVYGPDPGMHRRFPVQVWYPTNEKPAFTAMPWVPVIDKAAPLLGPPVGMPAFLLRHLAYVESHAYAGAAPAEPEDGAGYPVVIYSHGWTGFRTIALSEIEALAGAGFVVIAPDHTYGALFTSMREEVIPNNPAAMPPKEPAEAYQAGIERLVTMYADDIRCCVDLVAELQSGDEASPLSGKLNTDRIGLFGHSTGGGAVVQVAKTDERVKAVLGLDPWVLPVAPAFREKPREIPFASIRSGAWMDKKDKNHELIGEVIATFGEDGYDLYVPDTTHTDFTLMPLLSPLMPMVGMTGPLDGAISLETVDSALVAFFEAFLEGPSDPAWFERQVDGRYLRPADSNSDLGRKEAKAWEAVPVEISSRL